MDEEPIRPPPPHLDEHDKLAVKTILMKVIRSQDEIARDRALIAEATARIAANNLVNVKAISALTFFGFQAPTGVNTWNMVRDALGNDGYNQAVDEARGILPKLLQQMGVTENATVSDTVEATVIKKRPVQVRTAILDYMRSVGAKGASAAEVRQHLLDSYGLTVHEKTPGMTLYRLLKDGLVRRQGRTWFAKPHTEIKENEAPAANTEDASETALTAQ